MVEFQDRLFARTFFRQYAERPHRKPNLNDVTLRARGNHGRGLRIEVLHKGQCVVELGWWPEQGAVAAWPISRNPEFSQAMTRRSDYRLTRLVRLMLRRNGIIEECNRSWLEVDQEMDTVLRGIRDFGRAVEAGHWAYACAMWEVISTMDEAKRHPLYADIGPFLKRQKWLAEAPTIGIH